MDVVALRKKVPPLPGCYVWKDSAEKILYVGKAKNLKSRVLSYFAKDVGGKTALLMAHAADIELYVTDTEVEALVLENSLIKRHQPPYNIDLKSNVRYAYILLTDETWPRVLTVRTKRGRGTIYGPYVSGWERVRLIKLCVDLCKLRICSTLPKKPCLQYHIGKCDAPCIAAISHDDYMRQVKKAKKILEGKTEEIASELAADMERHSRAKEYEKAAEKRDQLALLRSVSDEQKVETRRAFDQDVFATFRVDGTVKIEVFQILRGVIAKREKYTHEFLTGQTLSDFLRAYYTYHTIPKEIIVDEELEDSAVLELFFSTQTGRKVDVLFPKLGEKKKLLEMVRQNAQVDLQDDYPELVELARVLKLKALPKVIECFDISNLGTTDVVAASVQYLDGKPNPSEFRRYEIRTVEGQDDFRSMYEAVFRRYRRLKEEAKQLPDLVVIDGGKVQLAFARKALSEAGVVIPMIALAKREEEIFLPYLSIAVTLPRNNAALKLLQRIRDSTHRFVLKYQRVKRGKRMLAK